MYQVLKHKVRNKKKGHNYALNTEVTCPQKCHIFWNLWFHKFKQKGNNNTHLQKRKLHQMCLQASN